MNEQNHSTNNLDQVLIDFDLTNKIITVIDETSQHSLNYPGDFWDGVFCANFKIANPNTYCFNWKDKLNFNAFVKRLKWMGINYIISDNLNNWLNVISINSFTDRMQKAIEIKNNDNWKKSPDFLQFQATINHEINPTITLKDKQLQNAYHHFKLQSSMDFSVPGTGKTYISYALFSYLFSAWQKEQLVNKLVVIGPLNCFKAWKDEAKTIFNTKHNFSIFDASTLTNDEKFSNIIARRFTIYLFNYEFFNSEKKIKILSDHLLDEKTLVVFDEIHRIKGVEAKRAGFIINLIKNAKHPPIYKLALTGTPLPNSYQDLTNYLKILYPVELKEELSSLNQDYLKQADNDFYKAKNIQKSFYPLFMRINKHDLHVPLPNPDDKETLAIKNLTQNELTLLGRIYKLCPNPFLRFIRLIQASSNPKLLLKKINGNEVKDIGEMHDELSNLPAIDTTLNFTEEDKMIINSIDLASKTKRTIEFIKEKVATNHPVIVWCLFIDTIDLLANELAKLRIKVTTICGRDTQLDRDDKIEAFKHHEYDVLITNPNTLAESVSLHKICHDAIYLEYGFNLTYLLQSKDRIHRVGLLPTDQTNYYFAMAKNTIATSPIDEYIYERLELKANRMKEAIDSKDLILPKKTSQSEDIESIMKQVK